MHASTAAKHYPILVISECGGAIRRASGVEYAPPGPLHLVPQEHYLELPFAQKRHGTPQLRYSKSLASPINPHIVQETSSFLPLSALSRMRV